ncbi:MAG: AAA family ATPase, partial [Acidobacteriota bacterium]
MSASNPYLGPSAFAAEDHDRFFGRRTDGRRLVGLASSEPVVVVVGPSGVGKSSLVNAELARRLRDDNKLVIGPVRLAAFFEELNDRRNGSDVHPVIDLLADKILAADELPGQRHLGDSQEAFLGRFRRTFGALGGFTLTDVLRAEIRRRKSGRFQRKVLILDQFEDLFTLSHSRCEEFFDQLRRALRDLPRVSVVLCLRDDHLAKLSRYSALLPGRLSCQYAVEPLSQEAAREAIVKPAADADRPFESTPDAVRLLLDDLLDPQLVDDPAWQDQVAPMILQVVCYRLWEATAGQATISRDDVKACSAHKAIREFYDSSLCSVAKAHSDREVTEAGLRLWMARHLVSHKKRAQVVRAPEQTKGLADEVIRSLIGARLVRSEAIRGGDWIELVHDHFVAPALAAAAKEQDADADLGAALTMARRWHFRDDDSLLARGKQLQRARRFLDEALLDGDAELLRPWLEASEHAELERQEATKKQRDLLARRNDEIKQQNAEIDQKNRKLDKEKQRRGWLLALLGVALVAVVVVGIVALGAASKQEQRQRSDV